MRYLVSPIVLLFLLPKIAWQCLLAFYQQRTIDIYSQCYLGAGMTPFSYRSILVNNRALADFDLWLHYLKGNLNFIGPKPLRSNQANRLSRAERQRFSVPPGIVSPYELKKFAGIAHEPEATISARFANNVGLIRRVQLTIIWIIQKSIAIDKHHQLQSRKSFKVFGIELANDSMTSAVQKIIKSLEPENTNHNARFAFVNAECINQAFSNGKYRESLKSFQAVFPDGIGIRIASRLHGYKLKENVNGTDMFPLLCEQLQNKGYSVYLHGAKKQVVQKLVTKLQSCYPNLRIAGYSDGYSFAKSPVQLCEQINSSAADILLLALGTPKQELWIKEHAALLNVKATLAVGGLFDFYSGEVKRAPEWLRELSLEWVWRLAQQPGDKAKRYMLGVPLFLLRCLRARFAHRYPSQAIWR